MGFNSARNPKKYHANPHEDEIISGGLSRILMYQRGPISNLGTPKIKDKLDVIREVEPQSVRGDSNAG